MRQYEPGIRRNKKGSDTNNRNRRVKNHKVRHGIKMRPVNKEWLEFVIESANREELNVD